MPQALRQKKVENVVMCWSLKFVTSSSVASYFVLWRVEVLVRKAVYSLWNGPEWTVETCVALCDGHIWVINPHHPRRHWIELYKLWMNFSKENTPAHHLVYVSICHFDICWFPCLLWWHFFFAGTMIGSPFNWWQPLQQLICPAVWGEKWHGFGWHFSGGEVWCLFVCQISQHVSSFLFFTGNQGNPWFSLVFFSVSMKISDLGRLERVMQRDKLKRFPAPLPKLVAWLIHSPQQWMFLKGNPVLDFAIEYSGKMRVQVVACKQKPIKNSKTCHGFVLQ